MKKKISKVSKRRLTVFGSISIAIIVYFLVSFVTLSIETNHLKKQNNSLERRLGALRSREIELSTEIEKLGDPEYVAKYARENYQYSKDGEYIIQFEELEENETVENNEKRDFTIPFILLTVIGSVILLRKKISH